MNVVGWARLLLRAVALATLLAGGALLWRSTRLAAPIHDAQTYIAGDREKSIVLRDGTPVLLAPGSRLIVSAAYGVARRDVDLAGEALFIVRPDTAHPFRVIAGAAVIRDLGATFTVRTRAGEEVEVVVSAGSVILSQITARPEQGVTLNTLDRATLSR